MPLQVGDLYASLGLDAKGYFADLAKARTEASVFTKKQWDAKFGIDTKHLQKELAGAKLQMAGLATSAKGIPIVLPLSVDPGPVKAGMRGVVSEMTSVLGQYKWEIAGAAGLALAAGLAYSVDQASDLNETMNKTKVVFGEAAQSVVDFAEEASDKLLLSRQAALEAMATFGNLFTSMGYGQEESAAMSERLVLLAADLASFNNVPVADALQAIRAGLIGETEPLRQFGVMLDEASLKAQAMRMGLDTAGASLPPMTRATAAYALILQQTKNAQGDVSETSDSLANGTKRVTSKLQDLGAKVGTEVLPKLAEMVGSLNDILTGLDKLPAGLAGTSSAFGDTLAVAGDLSKALGDISNYFTEISEKGLRAPSLDGASFKKLGMDIANWVMSGVDMVLGPMSIIGQWLRGKANSALNPAAPPAPGESGAPVSAHGSTAPTAIAPAAAGAPVAAAVAATAEDTAAAGAQLVGTLARIPKNAEQVLARDWTSISAGVRKAGGEITSAFADMSDEALKTFADRTGSVGSIAGGIGAVATSLAELPKKAVAPARQNWGALASMLRGALGDILGVFDDYSTKALGTSAERAGDIGSMAGSLGTFVGGLAGLPKKAVSPGRQNWAALATMTKSGLSQVLAVFEESTTKELARSAERAGSAGGAAGGLSALVSSLASLPDKAVTVMPQKWRALARVAKTAVDEVLAVFDDVDSKRLGADATRMGSIGAAAGGIGSLIGTLANLPDKAVSVVPQKWGQLAQVVRSAVAEVLAAFEDVTTKKLGKDAGRMGSVAGMAGSLGAIVSFFTAAPEEAVKVIPQAWRALGDAVRDAVGQFLDAYEGVGDELLKSQGDTMQLIGQMVGPLGSILDFIANAPKSAVSLVRQNWAELTSALIEAVGQLVTGFQAVWSGDELKANAADLGNVGTMVETIGSILDLASELPEKLGALEDFTKRAGSMGGIWQGVGGALLQIVTALSSALDQIPDMTRLQAAQAAVSTLRDIFASMSDLSKTMGSKLGSATAGGVALGVAGGGQGGVTQVVLPVFALSGEVSDGDLRSIAYRLEPYLGNGKVSVARTTF